MGRKVASKNCTLGIILHFKKIVMDERKLQQFVDVIYRYYKMQGLNYLPPNSDPSLKHISAEVKASLFKHNCYLLCDLGFLDQNGYVEFLSLRTLTTTFLPPYTILTPYVVEGKPLYYLATENAKRNGANLDNVKILSY